MKYFLLYLIAFLTLIACNNSSKMTESKPNETHLKNSTMKSNESIYEIPINNLKGDPINLADFKGKKILFVNVASECGFTPQYKDLQELHKTNGEKLVVIGVPCNQFGNQEPGNATKIESFCSKNYGVEFLITEKVDVKGKDQHPLYTWLTSKAKNGTADSSVKWNFQKYLIDENGNFIDFYYSITNPLDKKIVSKL